VGDESGAPVFDGTESFTSQCADSDAVPAIFDGHPDDHAD
jgi:hypothetical protein